MERVLRARLGKEGLEAARLSEQRLAELDALDKSSPEEAKKARKAFEAMIARATGMHVIGMHEPKPKGWKKTNKRRR